MLWSTLSKMNFIAMNVFYHGVLDLFFMLELNRLLDLSFNRIRTIQGLESLTKLKKLFLVSNKIDKIENIAHLKELEMLELGDNRIRVYHLQCSNQEDALSLPYS